MDDLNKLEDKLFHPNANLTEFDFVNRGIYQESFWHNMHIKESIYQKLSYKREKEGDNNTSLFHASMKAIHRRNYFGSIKTLEGRLWIPLRK